MKEVDRALFLLGQLVIYPRMVALTGSPGNGALKYGGGYGAGNKMSYLERDSGDGIGYGPQKTLSEIMHPTRAWVADPLRGDGNGYGVNGTSTGDG